MASTALKILSLYSFVLLYLVQQTNGDQGKNTTFRILTISNTDENI
jgi:hypothetical protein